MRKSAKKPGENWIFGAGCYTWVQDLATRNQKLEDHLDAAMSAVANAGLTAWEPIMPDASQEKNLGELLAKHRLWMPTVYAGARLHETNWKAEVERVVRDAQRMQKFGTRIIACNPDPIEWGKPIYKNDEQLAIQAGALKVLTSELKKLNMTLAYHTHAPELECPAARELHHMMHATEIGRAHV